jgi:phosphoglycolate phosphatase-like HAD superfamily hydrolase
MRGVIFDLDGTLGDTLPLCIKAFRQSVEPLVNRAISDEEIIATFGPSEEGTILALAPDHYDSGVEAYLKYYEKLHHMCPVPFDGIRELLEELVSKGIKVAMVTGKGKYSTDISLEYFGLTHFFELIETGSPEGPRKAQGIQAILDQWNDISKNDVIYVGDAPSDITACREAGIPVISAAWAETADPELLKSMNPDEIFYTIKEFGQWLTAKTTNH